MKRLWSLIFIIIIDIIINIYITKINNKTFDNTYFGITTINSGTDCDNDDIVDNLDLLEGARIDANNHVKYKSTYYDGGYPPDDEGVCTDLIWRAFKNAGYTLKDLVDIDIKSNSDIYNLNGQIDSNIDFRRVENLKIFFERNAINLSLDINDIASFQAGDIVTFANEHIAIISDKRNSQGIPYLIHNAGQLFKGEDNTFSKWTKNMV